MAPLQLDILGGFDLRLASGAGIKLPTRKSRLLLAYLALAQGRAQPRVKLMGLLWSDRAEAQARGSLRQELHALRHGLAAIDPQPLWITGDAVALDMNAVRVDASLFEHLIGRGEPEPLARAAALYRGDLLEGMAAADPAFDDWLIIERRRLRDLAVSGLGTLLRLEIERGALDTALTTARRLLVLDQVHEEAHRALMRLLARQGQRNEALRQYQLCRALLARELGVEPEEATEQLHRELLACRRTPMETPGQPLTEVVLPAEAWCHFQPAQVEEKPVGMPTNDGTEASRHQDAPAPAGPEPERRQITVMFVDMVDSTRLATGLDPEELREVLGAYQDAVSQMVTRFGGHVDHFLGDGVLAWFGWPQAHEDDAERAVRAGLAAVEAVSQLPMPQPGTLACRVGIATGLVVAGGPGGGAQAIAGEAPYLATRLQATGAPGTVIVAETTRRLLGRLFALEDLGSQPLKGFAAPVQAWRIAGEGQAESRFEALRWASGTPLIGRRQELALLLERWEQAKEGEGQVVLLAGEAGIGKSRLVRALCEQLGGVVHGLLAHHCSPYHGNSALYPVAECLRRAAGLALESSPERQLDRLKAMLALPAEDIRDGTLLLADLLAIPASGCGVQTGLSPQRRKERTFQLLLDHLAGLAARQPVLALYKDVHWADPTTLDLLHRVIGRVQQLPVLAVITFRPDFAPPWTGHGHTTTLSLGRLGRRYGMEMVKQVAGGRAIPREALEQILTRADGVPLFLEELTRAVLASDLHNHSTRYERAGPLPNVTVPATLKDSLVAQLDRLDVVKQVTQTGAVIGCEFTFELLAMVTAMPENELRLGLERLVDAGLLHRNANTTCEAYAFKHALVRDAAYEGLLRNRRRELHAQVAQALERIFPVVVAREPELLAHHYTEAGLDGQAIHYWHLAAQRAVQRYANAEAIGHFRQALRLVAGLPAGSERDRTELLLQMGLGLQLMAAKGYAAPEVQQVYARASELCQHLDDAPALFPILFGLCLFHLVRPNMPAARPIAVRLLAAAREAGDDDLMLEACGLAGAAELYAGKLVAAASLLEQGFALYRSERHRDHAARYGQDPLVTLAFVARAHALAGRLDLARQRGGALLAATLTPAAQPNSLAGLHAHLAQLHLVLRDGAMARKHAEAVIAVSQQQDLPLWTGLGLMYRGAALIEDALSRGDRSQVAEGMTEGLKGMATYRATGAGLDVVTCMTWFAAGYARLGRPAEGLRLLDEALRIIADTGEAYYAAEVHRLVGELTLALENPDRAAAEASLRAGLAIAQRQRARLLERRAAASLARLWFRQGRREQAHHLLTRLRCNRRKSQLRIVDDGSVAAGIGAGLEPSSRPADAKVPHRVDGKASGIRW